MNKASSPSMRVRLGAVALASLSFVAVGSEAATSGEAAKAVVRATADDVIAVLKDASLSSDQKREKIIVIVDRNFDFTTLSRLVLARNWAKLSKAQQEEFIVEFKRHLSITYGNNVENYRDEKVVITGDREEARGDWTVKSIIERPTAEDVKVDYRLRQLNGEWRMIDMIVEGVSLVANFRSQFQDIIAKNGPAKVIELLRQKNDKAGPLKS